MDDVNAKRFRIVTHFLADSFSTKRHLIYKDNYICIYNFNRFQSYYLEHSTTRTRYVCLSIGTFIKLKISTCILLHII